MKDYKTFPYGGLTSKMRSGSVFTGNLEETLTIIFEHLDEARATIKELKLEIEDLKEQLKKVKK